MNTIKFLILVAFLFTGCRTGLLQQDADQTSLNSLLNEMIDRNRLARFPDPDYTCKQFSSYDRKSVTADDHENWFANYDRGMFLAEEEVNGRTEWVMMDIEGPGAVVRIWSANPAGHLRIYLDRDPEPVIEAPMVDALNGNWIVGDPLSAERSKGHNLYLPIPYAKHCKITSDADDFYYQVNYRTYAAGTEVKTLTKEALQQCLPKIEETGRALLKQGAYAFELHLPEAEAKGTRVIKEARSDDSPEIRSTSKQLAQGESLRLRITSPRKLIRQLSISPVCNGHEPDNRSLVLKISFDGEQTVWCPLSDFFGTGAGTDQVQDFYRSVNEEGQGCCFWPMPFKRNAEIVITNLGSKPKSVALTAVLDDWTWDDRSMHFYACWRYDYPIATDTKHDWNYIDIQGQGLFVGDNLAVMNPSHIWWGEGDEKIYVDGEPFPSHFGTGTEDYYGYAWCYPEPFLAPFHGQARCDGFDYERPNNWGHTTVSRVRALDAIPFENSFKFDMEVWHWRECEVAYGVATFFYARPGAKHNRPSQPEAAAAPIPEAPPLPPPLKIEGALECEDLEVAASTEGLELHRQDMFGIAMGCFSAEMQLYVKAQKIGEFLELAIPAPNPGPYQVTLYATRSWDYGIVTFFVNGQKAGESIDLFSDSSGTVAPTGPIDLGLFDSMDGKITLRTELVGGNPESGGTKSYFGLDAVVLKQPR